MDQRIAAPPAFWLWLLGIRALGHTTYSQGLGISLTHEQSWYKQTYLYMAAEPRRARETT